MLIYIDQWKKFSFWNKDVHCMLPKPLPPPFCPSGKLVRQANMILFSLDLK